MLVRLVREYLAPYRARVAAIVALQFVGTVAALYLPSLNANIIDNGVVTGDTGFILRFGGLMLAVSCIQMTCSIAGVWFSAGNAMEDGVIVEQGNHDELLAAGGAYARLYQSQFAAAAVEES